VYNTVKEITTRINAIIKRIEGGKGILGKLFVGETLYENQGGEQESVSKTHKKESEYVPLTALGSILGKVTE